MKVILIEDDKGHEFLIRNAFKKFNGSVSLMQSFDTGEEALVQLNSNSAVDLILLDLNLPGMYGLDVLKTLKSNAKLKHIPVVILTTSNRATDIFQAYQNHVAGYMVKPVTFDKFVEVAGAILGFFGKVELPNAIA